MTNLNNKVQEFRHQFNITKSFKDDQVFNRSLKKISASKNFGEKYSSKIAHFSPHFSHSKNLLKKKKFSII